MVNSEATQLDLVFAALSDATRRSVLVQLERLAQQGEVSCSVSELAQPHGMSLPGFMKHLAVLEAAGLIARAKAGRVVRCELDAAPMQAAARWISRYERFWTERFDALDRFLHQQEASTPCPLPSPNPVPPSSAKPQAKSASRAATASRPKKSGAPGPRRKR
ncbi:ArsR family transcriptional regulator [Ideonella azotifigens]|uniref:HTH arsR-type domain-containing protein n=1 Tax=Ideonella azotifigens TaxID=513160 RepID=A0ABN1KKP2_9BURK|nr:helix-turn-helix transcriptional regulator [Ideonella azotifigens]MCD2339201.1 ArsR family transcriptional regulator [Ideonella azotifigens]